jgi:hypothetical protein
MPVAAVSGESMVAGWLMRRVYANPSMIWMHWINAGVDNFLGSINCLKKIILSLK